MAPRYTHSCNRYFSACQFIPYCCGSREEQVDSIAAMTKMEWNPLHSQVAAKTEAE